MSLSFGKLRPYAGTLQLTLSYRLLLFSAVFAGRGSVPRATIRPPGLSPPAGPVTSLCPNTCKIIIHFNKLFRSSQTAEGPASSAGGGATRFGSVFSSPGGGGTPGYRAGPPQPNYAQAPSGHGGRDPGEPFDVRIPIQDRSAGLPDDGRSGAAGDARIVAWALLGVAREPSLALRPPFAGQGQPRPAFASASCAAFRDDRRRVHRAAPEFRFAPAAAIRRFAAYAGYARSVPAPVECTSPAFEAPRSALRLVTARKVTV